MEENESLLKKILNAFSSQEGLHDLLAMSRHHSGFKRENAVRRLGMLGNPLAISELLVRANDWVPQVRTAAMDALRKLMTGANAQAFVHSLPDLHRLERCRRADHAPLVAEVNRFLLRPENVPFVTAAIDSEDSHIARLTLRLCIDHALLGDHLIVSRCLQHRDVVVRNMASDFLRKLSGEDLERALERAIRDPFMPIRREAFQIYLRELPEQGRKIAHRLLFDNHNSIREIAIAQLLRIGTDVEGIFVQLLSSTGHSVMKVRCALLGVAHLGATHLIALVEKHADAPLPGVRRTALQALARLAGDRARPFLLQGLKDPSRGVAKSAMTLLDKSPPYLDELLDVVDTASHPHTQEVCVLAARRANKWDRLIFLFTLCGRLKPEDRAGIAHLSEELGRWDNDFNRSYNRATNAQKNRMRATYRSCVTLLDEHRRRAIEFTLGAL